MAMRLCKALRVPAARMMRRRCFDAILKKTELLQGDLCKELRLKPDEVVCFDELRGYLECAAEMCYQSSGSRRLKNPRIWSMHDLAVMWRDR